MDDIGLKNTPQYDSYEDEIQNKQSFSYLKEDLEQTLEVSDQSIRVEILLQRGDQMATGNVVVWSNDANQDVLVEPMQIQFWILDCIR